jgi:hypothetical protein
MSSPRKKMPLWKRLLLVFAVIFVFVVAKVGYDLYQLVHYEIPESYDAWTTGALVVGYLHTHSNQWPRNWEDLQSATNSNLPKSGFVPIGRLRQSVKIDWLVDVANLQEMVRTNPNATIHVVTRIDGLPLKARWGPDTEPNGIIVTYLKATLTTSNTALEPLTVNSASSLPKGDGSAESQSGGGSASGR